MDLLDAIPIGHANAIRRRDLCARLGTSDRLVRRMIEQARTDGHLILNIGDGRGYFQVDMSDPGDLDLLECQCHMDTSRALSVLAHRKTAREILRKRGRKV